MAPPLGNLGPSSRKERRRARKRFRVALGGGRAKVDDRRDRWTRGEPGVLQIVTKMYFREGVPLHSTVHREVLYTNRGFLCGGVVDSVGELAPSTGVRPRLRLP